MNRFSLAESATVPRLKGLPDDVEALKALVIDLHGRAHAQELHIQQQREGLRILAQSVKALQRVACGHADHNNADHYNAGERDEAMVVSRGGNGRNGSG